MSHITKNLISVDQFCKDNNVYFLFNANECLVKSQETDDILLRGRVGSDGLYMFPGLGLQAAKSSISLHSGPYVNSVSYVNNSFCITISFCIANSFDQYM